MLGISRAGLLQRSVSGAKGLKVWVCQSASIVVISRAAFLHPLFRASLPRAMPCQGFELDPNVVARVRLAPREAAVGALTAVGWKSPEDQRERRLDRMRDDIKDFSR